MCPLPDLDNLKSLRLSLQISQHDLAKRAGVSQSLIAKIESGRIDPSLSNARKIAAALIAESPKGVVLKDIMSKELVCFSPETAVLDAIKVMRKHAISQFPVLKDGVVIGRISESSILEHVESLDSLSLENIMLPPPPLLDKDALVQDVFSLLRTYTMVLVADKGMIIGIVTRADVMGLALKGGL